MKLILWLQGSYTNQGKKNKNPHNMGAGIFFYNGIYMGVVWPLRRRRRIVSSHIWSLQGIIYMEEAGNHSGIRKKLPKEKLKFVSSMS